MNGLKPGVQKKEKFSKKGQKVLDMRNILCYHVKVRCAEHLYLVN